MEDNLQEMHSETMTKVMKVGASLFTWDLFNVVSQEKLLFPWKFPLVSKFSLKLLSHTRSKAPKRSLKLQANVLAEMLLLNHILLISEASVLMSASDALK